MLLHRVVIPLLAVARLSASLFCGNHQLTVAEEYRVRVLLEDLFEDGKEVVIVNGETHTQEPFLGGMLRFIAHDCVGGFGVDGCLNMDVRDNQGFDFLFDAINQLYEMDGTIANNTSIGHIMSRGDFWVLASYVAAERAARKQCEGKSSDCTPVLPSLTFLFGRQDCTTSPYSKEIIQFPFAGKGLKPNLQVFTERFGFSARELIALLGAHSLGRARRSASGYDGIWTANPDVLDNRYYSVLSNSSLDWVQKDVSRDYDSQRFFQWVPKRENGLFMLNADMGLFKEVTLDDDGRSSCSFDTCASSDGAQFVDMYANDLQLWMDDFSAVFTKFTNMYSPNLKTPLAEAVPDNPLTCPDSTPTALIPQDNQHSQEDDDRVLVKILEIIVGPVVAVVAAVGLIIFAVLYCGFMPKSTNRSESMNKLYRSSRAPSHRHVRHRDRKVRPRP